MEKNNCLFVYTDGGSRGNPGLSACSFIIQNESGETIYEEGKFLGKNTNNIAEYFGVYEALKWLNRHQSLLKKTSQIIFNLDSQLVVNQLNGIFKIKSTSLKEMVFKINSLIKQLNLRIYFKYLPREKNFKADLLVNKTLDQALNLSPQE